MFKIIFQLVFIFLSLISLVACQQEESSSHTERRQAPKPVDEAAVKAYRDSSCAFSPKINGGANLDYLGMERIEATYFGKLLNIYPLAGIISADLESSFEFLSKAPLKVYKVPSDKGGCKNYSSLQLAPQAILNEWDKLNSAMGSKDAFLLGLFLPAKKVKQITGFGRQPAIIYREDTEKWTLVHEFMHYLFNFQRESHGEDVLKNQEEIMRIGEEFDQTMNGASQEDLKDPVFIKKVSLLFMKHENLLLNHLKNFPLEEMTIETNLIAMFDNNTLNYTTEYSRLGAAWYIQSSFKTFAELINQESEAHDKVKQYAIDLYLTDLVTQFEDFEKTAIAVVEEAQALNKQAEEAFKAGTGQLHGLTSKNYEHLLKKKCAHSEGLNKIKIPKVRFKSSSKKSS
jgi:hypothetical protein